MPILDTILTTPVNVRGLIHERRPLETQLDGAFSNLLYYAKLNWQYVASGQAGGDDLLAGTAVAAPCGGIATALKKVFIDGLGVSAVDIQYIRVTGYLWTSSQYLCFDPLTRGNIRALDKPGSYHYGCIFNEHYYLKCGGKYYDPCLSTTYAVENQCIKERFNGLNAPMEVGNDRRKIMFTADRRTCFLYMRDEPVHSFSGSWAMFDATKKNVERALGPVLFKDEMTRQNGQSSFAKLVKALR